MHQAELDASAAAAAIGEPGATLYMLDGATLEARKSALIPNDEYRTGVVLR